MPKLLAILLVALVLEAIGVVFLNHGLKQIGPVSQFKLAEIVRVIQQGGTNPSFLLGLLFETLFFIGLLILLSKSDVSFIWPLTSMGFVLTTLAAKIFLREEVSGMRWTGVFLIMAGAALITWTEQNKSKPAHAVSIIESRSD